MSRTFELGRAVLNATNSPHQLWFTTLITISAQHETTNLQDIKQTDFLDQLLAGNFWVRRGDHLHLALELNVEGEPLEREEQDRLTDSLINAPAWSQLNLRASLPVGRLSEDVMPDKTIHIGVHHARNDNDLQVKQPHRLGLNVPFADVGPPVGVPVLTLQSVNVSMNLLNVKPRLRLKQLKPSTQSCQRNLAEDTENECENKSEDTSLETKAESELLEDILPAEPQPLLEPAKADSKNAFSRPSQSKAGHRPKQAPICHPVNNMAEAQVATPFVQGKKRKRVSSPAIVTFDVERFVDAAMRISICKGTPKLAQGVKVVTKAFIASLADLCPALWSPEYLPALSQRAHFLPTISRAIGRVATREVRSLPLQMKIQKLANHSTKSNLYKTNSQDPLGKMDHNRVTQSLHPRLWMYTQNFLAEKSTRPLDTFWSSNSQHPQVQNTKESLFDYPATLHEPSNCNPCPFPDDEGLDVTPSNPPCLTARKCSLDQSVMFVSDRTCSNTEKKCSHQRLDNDDLLLESTPLNFIDHDLDKHGHDQTDFVAEGLMRENRVVIHPKTSEALVGPAARQNPDSLEAHCMPQEPSYIPHYAQDSPVLFQSGILKRNSDDPDEMLLWASTDPESATAF